MTEEKIQNSEEKIQLKEEKVSTKEQRTIALDVHDSESGMSSVILPPSKRLKED